MISRQRGFTLIELLVVVAIIGLLASIVLSSLNTARAKARDTERISDIKELRTALQLYYEDHNQTYPTNLSALAPTYIPAIPIDPLGSSNVCRSPYYYCYAYSPSANPTTFHLGAQLENKSIVLSSDADCNSVTGSNCPVTTYFPSGACHSSSCVFDGTDNTYYMYDLTP